MGGQSSNWQEWVTTLRNCWKLQITCQNVKYSMAVVNNHWFIICFNVLVGLFSERGPHRDCDQRDKLTTRFPPKFLLFMTCLFPAVAAGGCWVHSVRSSGRSFKGSPSIDLPSGQSADHLWLEGARLQKDAHKDRFVPESDWRGVLCWRSEPIVSMNNWLLICVRYIPHASPSLWCFLFLCGKSFPLMSTVLQSLLWVVLCIFPPNHLCL